MCREVLAVKWCQRVRIKKLGRWAPLDPFKEHGFHAVNSRAFRGWGWGCSEEVLL